MINGAHVIMFSPDADADRAFFSEVLDLPAVDAGRGWLIFALPPAELAVHPSDGEESRHELYLMCDDIRATVDQLQAKGVTFTADITEQRWGLITTLELPSGSKLALYEPRHPSPVSSPKQ